MNLDPGTRFGPYEIVSPLAAGGMGEVYKARDTRLDRTVAIKILPKHLSADPELRQRFEREARAISALAHPNICTLFDVGSADGTEYIVMEYLEGQTLSERISEGPMPLPEVIRCAIEIADALEKAHRMGIVHRDLKPGNVMMTRSGSKLLDFGLAKWITRTPASALMDPITDRIDVSSQSDDPTQRYSATVAGTLLGTVPYMAPEQLDGKPVDARTDIFAFGAIVYEMATGTRAFNAGSQASLIAAIIHDQPPPLSRMRVAAPARLDQIIRTCLAKDPGERFQSAHDVKLALEWLSMPEPEAAVKPAEKRVPWVVPAVLGATLAIAALSFVAARRWPQTSDAEARTVRFAIPPPPGAGFPSLGEGGGFAVAPDGRTIAFVASTPDGRPFLWLRALDNDEPVKLDGTEGATYPFWSPDSKSVAFFANGKLKRLDVPRGAAQTICDATGGRGGTWNAEGVILFSPSSKNGLYRVAAGGGTPSEVTSTATGEIYSHRWPVFLPDGRHFLFLGQSQNRAKHGLYAGALDSKEVRYVMPVAGSVAFAAPDRLYFVRDGVLIRQTFDLKNLQPSGEPSTIADGLVFFADRAYVPISASASGVLAYRRNAIVNTRLNWYSREGRALAALGGPGEIEGISLSPDESKLAFGQFDASEGMNHIVVAGAADGVPRRFSFARGNQYSPVWSPDGSRVAFSDDHSGVDTLTEKSSAGGDERPLFRGLPPSSQYALCWSPDGRDVIYRGDDPKNGLDIEALDVATGVSRKIIATPADESQAQLSPDGRLIAYASTENGRPEVYVQTFPATGAKWQVSTEGGEQPRWRRDGRELFYVAADKKLMVAAVRSVSGFDADPPKPLFETAMPVGYLGVSQEYDVSRDGQRIVIAAGDPLHPQTGINVVVEK